jgi:hypothetical protein
VRCLVVVVGRVHDNEKSNVSSVAVTLTRRVMLDCAEVASIMTWGVDPHST